jgi:hypothetical protein
MERLTSNSDSLDRGIFYSDIVKNFRNYPEIYARKLRLSALKTEEYRIMM